MGARVLLVTGGSRGIGAAIARLAAKEGYAVGINYFGNDAAAETVLADCKRAGAKAIAVKGDVASADDVTRFFDASQAALGRVTHLANNAGIVGRNGKLGDADPQTIRRVVDVNVTGALLVAREAVRRMTPEAGGEGGAIVNLSSMAATLGSPGEYVWYAASKGAIDALTVGLSKEVAPLGIRVNAVSPGLIDTDIHASGGQPDRVERLRTMIPLGRAGTAEEVADLVLYLLSGRAAYITGSNTRVSGGR
jgi:NAD(P)-dependent dehydrogenase (short-subunit alcohol dehydrogenase family)